MAAPQITAQAQQLFDEMITQGLTLPSIEARCDQVEIDAVHALHRQEITAPRKEELINISFEIRRLAAQQFVNQTLFPRR